MENNSGWPKITVIIPTRERADVFAAALKTVTAQNYENLEIIVSDNFSSDGTEEIARGAGDPRLRYLNTGRRLSMSHNWEFALSHATGDWVAVVGDDDGLLPGALGKVADIIRETGTLAIQSETCKYRWPGNKARAYGRIRVPMRRGTEIRKSAGWIEGVALGRKPYAELPMLYTGGFVSMSVLAELKRRTGAFYKSRIPDVYTGFAVASLLPDYVYSFAPLAIGGVSKHSIGVDQFARAKKKPEESPALKFANEENILFHPAVPLLTNGDIPPALQAVVIESYLQTIPLREGQPVESFDRLLGGILASEPEDHEPLLQWAAVFARMHGLDLEGLRRQARQQRRLLRLEAIPRNFIRRFNRKNLGSPALPLRDVHEASLAAAAALGRR